MTERREPREACGPEMKRILLAIALTASWVESTVCAQADDSEIIAACVQGERDAGRPPLNCVGRVSDPCLESSEGQSTAGMVACTDKETKVWDEMLNEEYGRLIGLLSSKAAEAVRQAQRDWIALRDADCKVPYEIFEGGTMAQPIAANCVLTHTADRAMQVRAWRDMAQPQ